MFEIIQSKTYEKWFSALKDRQAIARINMRIRRLSAGLFGDCKQVASGIHELRIDYGPGYRVYFMRSGPLVIVLLAGGDKSTQTADINLAIEVAKHWKE
jgi:putative addiction module killer protein